MTGRSERAREGERERANEREREIEREALVGYDMHTLHSAKGYIKP